MPRFTAAIDSSITSLSLAEGVAVGADDIEDLRRAAERRLDPSVQNVPGVTRVVGHLVLGLVGEVGTVSRRNDLDHRLHMHHPRVRHDLADRAYAGDRRLAQRAPQAQSRGPVAAERRDPAPFAPAEAPEGDLVDRGKEVRPAHARCHVFRRRAAVAGEPRGKARVVRVGPVGIAVVAEVPDRQHLRGVDGLDHRLE
jgi:hypothetical protein